MKTQQKTAEVRRNFRVTDFVDIEIEDDISLPPNQKFTLHIDYPLDRPARFVLDTGASGMGEMKLVCAIAKSYKEVYKSDAKYGIWGHSIGDLFIESIKVNFQTKEITLGMGS